MKSKIILAVLSMALFSACNSETSEGNNTPPMETQQEGSVTLGNEDPAATMQLDPNASQEISLQDAANNATPQGTTAGLNPEHGMPGHRCDIAVGSPLNSAPTTPQNAPQPINMTPMQTPSLADQPGNVKLNPAHGEPGHRCDLQVGAPLS